MPDYPTYLFFHTIVGGVRLSQEQITSTSCNPDRPTKHASECHEVSNNFQAPGLHNFFSTRDDFVNLPGSETHYLHSNTSRSDILEALRVLEDDGWLNMRSNMVEILFTTHNPHLDIFIATHIRFFMNRAGHIHKSIEPMCQWLYPYHGWWCYLTDLSWLLLVLKLLSE